MRVVFSERAYSSIISETASKISTETGGLFLGQVSGDIWYVIEAIDPGESSVFEVAYFEYDREYTTHLANVTARLYRTPLKLIGLWHRHPGSFDSFSYTDNGTNIKYARLAPETGAISALVNIDPDFRLTVYHVDADCRYRKIPYDVGDTYIPGNFLRQVTSLDDCLGGRREGADEVKEALAGRIKEIIDGLPLVMSDMPMCIEDEYVETLLCSLERDLGFLDSRFGGVSLMRRRNLLCVKVGNVLEIDFACMVTRDGFACSHGEAWHEYHSGDIAEGVMSKGLAGISEQAEEDRGFFKCVKGKIKCLMERLQKNTKS